MMLKTADLVKTSYSPEDITFLLKDMSKIQIESNVDTREKAFSLGHHYSESLPIEYRPSEEYLRLYNQAMLQLSSYIAQLVGIVTRRVHKFAKTDHVVIVSLARAGSPVGILMRRYARSFLDLDWPHFSVSILRGKGIDENAIKTIRELYPNYHLQFVDGWTGKGAIQKELTKSIQKLNQQGLHLNDDLAVLSDPGGCATLYSTREDILIPNAFLNSTVSGLISRTILNNSFQSREDYHGAKYYADLEEEDVSNAFVDQISAHFLAQEKAILTRSKEFPIKNERTWLGMQVAQEIAHKYYKNSDLTKVKPSVGETTRTLLRRKPYKILLRDESDEAVKHILSLCQEKNIPIEIIPDLYYRAIGLIESEELI